MKRSQVERKFPSFEVSATAQRLRRICDTLFHIPHILHSRNFTSLKIRLLLRQNFVGFVLLDPSPLIALPCKSVIWPFGHLGHFGQPEATQKKVVLGL